MGAFVTLLPDLSVAVRSSGAGRLRLGPDRFVSLLAAHPGTAWPSHGPRARISGPALSRRPALRRRRPESCCSRFAREGSPLRGGRGHGTAASGCLRRPACTRGRPQGSRAYVFPRAWSTRANHVTPRVHVSTIARPTGLAQVLASGRVHVVLL